MAKKKPATYKCEACGGVFEKGWSDKEAMAESQALLGEIPTEDQAVVCDDCFQRVMCRFAMGRN